MILARGNCEASCVICDRMGLTLELMMMMMIMTIMILWWWWSPDYCSSQGKLWGIMCQMWQNGSQWSGHNLIPVDKHAEMKWRGPKMSQSKQRQNKNTNTRRNKYKTQSRWHDVPRSKNVTRQGKTNSGKQTHTKQTKKKSLSVKQEFFKKITERVRGT